MDDSLIKKYNSRVVAPQGIIIQVYRDKIAGKTRQERLDWCARRLDEAVSLGITGIAWHGFVGELDTETFSALGTMCHDRGLSALAAFGLGQDSNHHPDYAGQWMGIVADAPWCDGIVLDAEGRWEDESPRIEAEHSRDLRLALRSKAPHALVIDQPWPVPTLHWSAFPWEEFARCVDIRAPQYYVNDWKKQHGLRRYARCWSWFNDSWRRLETERLKPQNLVRPRFPTIQGYGWGDIPKDLDDCLLRNPTMLVWAEPWPDASFIEGLKRLQESLKDPACRQRVS